MKTNPLTIEATLKYPKSEPSKLHVRLHFDALIHLMDDARQLLRVYELFQIQRPRDIWNHVWCEVVSLPERKLAYLDGRFHERKYWRPEPPASFFPFIEFDGEFYDRGWDTEPEDWAWLRARTDGYFPEQATAWLEAVKQTQREVAGIDSTILAGMLPSIRSGTHLLDFKPRPRGVPTLPGYQSPAIAPRSAEFYNKLRRLVSDPSITSVAAMGDSDFMINRIIFEEQRTRPEEGSEALHVCMSSDRPSYFDEWMVKAACYEEGLGDADLLIDYPREGRLQSRAANGMSREYNVVFTPEDAGDLHGYERESAEHWTIYSNKDARIDSDQPPDWVAYAIRSRRR